MNPIYFTNLIAFPQEDADFEFGDIDRGVADVKVHLTALLKTYHNCAAHVAAIRAAGVLSRARDSSDAM
jgi:hypothetical protein